MASYEDYEKDYWAPDREDVLSGVKKYGTDDRSQWVDKPQAQANEGTGLGREAWRDWWTSQGTMGVDDARQKLQGAGATEVGGNGTWRTPQGELLDLGKAWRTGTTTATWTPVFDPQNPGSYPGVSSNSGNPGQVSPGLMNPGGGDLRQQLIDQLLKRSQQSLNVTRNDPTIRAQVDPYAAQATRASRDFVSDVAEKSGPSANIRGEQRLASERAGQAAGLRESQVIGSEVDARRQEIAQALSGLQGQLTSEQQQALSRELANLNAEVARRGQDINWQQSLLQNTQFDKDLGLRAEDRYNYWDALRSGLLN